MKEVLNALKELNVAIDRLKVLQNSNNTNSNNFARIDSLQELDIKNLNFIRPPAKLTPANAKTLSSMSWTALVELSHLPRLHELSNGPQVCAALVTLQESIKAAAAAASSTSAAVVSVDCFHLDKLIANISVKLFSFRIAKKQCSGLIEFLRKSFDRLHLAAATVSSGIDDKLANDINRRLSLQQSLVEGIQFDFPIPQDRDLKQCYAIALDGLLKVVLVKEEACVCLGELIRCVLAVTASTKALMRLLSWCSKLDTPVTKNEWQLWCRIVLEEAAADVDWDAALHYYSKRSVKEYWQGPLELIAPLTGLPLQSQLLLECSTGRSCVRCSALTGLLLRACKGPQTNEDFAELARIISTCPSWREPTMSELKALLAVLDDLRTGFFCLVKQEGALQLFTAVNEALLKGIKMPAKYASAWSTQLLRSITDSRLKLTETIKAAVTSAIELLLFSPGVLDGEFREKSLKAAAQCVPLTGNVSLLQAILVADAKLLSVVLDRIVDGVGKEFMATVSEIVFKQHSQQQQHHVLLKSWVNALSMQSTIIPLPSSTTFATTATGKAIAMYMLDDFKADRYLDGILDTWPTSEQTFAGEYFSILRPLKKPIQPSTFPVLNSIKNNIPLAQPITINSKSPAQIDAHFVYLEQALKRERDFDVFLNELRALKDACSVFVPVFKLFTEQVCSVESDGVLAALHQLYLTGDNTVVLKSGYDLLRRLLPHPLDFLQVCIYLHRLAIVTGAASEASWFLKQIAQFAETSHPVKHLHLQLKQDYDILCSRDNCFNQSAIESLLESEKFSIFSKELLVLRELQAKRRSLPPLSFACKEFRGENGTMKYSGSTYNLNYFNILQAKIDLHLAMSSTNNNNNQPEWLLQLFYRAMGYPSNETTTTTTSSLLPLDSSTLGILCDWGLNAIWFLSTCSQKHAFVLFRIPIDASSLFNCVKEFSQITHSNTETLKNTCEIAADPVRRADWWKKRKELDSQLEQLIRRLDFLLFSDSSSIFLPSFSVSHIKSTNLAQELKSNMAIDAPPGLAEKLVTLGSFPKRAGIEMLLKLFACKVTDNAVATVRKCFENALELGSIFNGDDDDDDVVGSVSLKSINLLLDKTLCSLPWESFPSLRGRAISFRRVLLGVNKQQPTSSLQSVFYIINPSGDLIKTQERFETLFAAQPRWKGIIGRKPSAEEFFHGIAGEFDLFIYFGHAGGEIYAPLHELKKNQQHQQILKREGKAAAALLVGCSSGKVRVNGVFPAQSTVFHYLDNESPLVLAALWDVTDKDIDTYIRNVIDKSGLLENKATLASIDQQAQASRNTCFLKALNGYAPIVYAPLK